MGIDGELGSDTLDRSSTQNSNAVRFDVSTNSGAGSDRTLQRVPLSG